MTLQTKNWSVTLGIILGVVLGVAVSKTLDRWPSPVLADERETREGKKMAHSQAETFRAAAKAIAPTVVNITTMHRGRVQEGGGLWFDDFGMPFYKRPKIKEGLFPRGVGSGFIFDAKNGYILTNNHVVAEGDSYVVRLSDKRELEAKLVGADPQTDVAVLKIDAPNLVAALLGNADELEVGDWVLACGNPFGLLEQTVTAGIVSAKGRRGLNISNYEDFIQTDAAINQGNSGGPLVNLEGEVVGINSAIFSKTGGYQGVGFAIPINQAKKVAMQIIKRGSVVRGWMGVEVRDLTSSEQKRLVVEGGASVEGVYMRGPAQQGGITPGDILVKINGKPVRSSGDIRDMVADIEPGTQIPIQVKRKEEQKMLTVTVGTQPKDWGVNQRVNNQ